MTQRRCTGPATQDIRRWLSCCSLPGRTKVLLKRCARYSTLCYLIAYCYDAFIVTWCNSLYLLCREERGPHWSGHRTRSTQRWWPCWKVALTHPHPHLHPHPQPYQLLPHQYLYLYLFLFLRLVVSFILIFYYYLEWVGWSSTFALGFEWLFLSYVPRYPIMLQQ